MCEEMNDCVYVCMYVCMKAVRIVSMEYVLRKYDS